MPLEERVVTLVGESELRIISVSKLSVLIASKYELQTYTGSSS